jgi:FixJ family two-component response regulator
MTSNPSNPLVAIVDDDPGVCRAVKRLLASVCIDAVTFSSGTEFLTVIDALPTFAPECVILDVHMRGMGGYAVLKRLACSRPCLGVILLTASDDPQPQRQPVSPSVIARFAKPLDEHVGLFLKTVCALLDRAGPRSGSETPQTKGS